MTSRHIISGETCRVKFSKSMASLATYSTTGNGLGMYFLEVRKLFTRLLSLWQSLHLYNNMVVMSRSFVHSMRYGDQAPALKILL